MAPKKDTRDLLITADARAISRTIDTLSYGCKPGSYIREFTHNGADAFKLWYEQESETNPDATGNIIICKDKTYPNKIVFSNGPGVPLTEDIAKTCLASLGNSGTSDDENFGIGAKISYLPRNPEGIIYRSRQEESQFNLHKNSQNLYGFKTVEVEDEDGRTLPANFWYCDESEFVHNDSETEVVLMGASPDVDTWIETCTLASKTPERTSTTGHTIVDYLNMRYWEPLHPNLDVKVEIHQKDKAPFLRKVTFLKKLKESLKLNGTLEHPDGVKMHYFTTNYEKGKKKETHVTTGYYGYIYNNEIYIETDISNSVRRRRMESLGILTHHQHVMVLVEFPDEIKLQPTADRNRIVDTKGTDVEHQLTDYAQFFRENMPEDLKTWMQSLYEHRSIDVRKWAAKYYKKKVIDHPSLNPGTGATGGSSGSGQPNQSSSPSPSGALPKRKRKKPQAGTSNSNDGGPPEFKITREEGNQPLISFPLSSYTISVNANNELFCHWADIIAEDPQMQSIPPEKIMEGFATQLYLATCCVHASLLETYGKEESEDVIEERMSDDRLNALATDLLVAQAKKLIRSQAKVADKHEAMSA